MTARRAWAGSQGFACIAPLCRFHHFELHIIGPEFESRYGVSLAFAAAQTRFVARPTSESVKRFCKRLAMLRDEPALLRV
jgi:hypothetical protein